MLCVCGTCDVSGCEEFQKSHIDSVPMGTHSISSCKARHAQDADRAPLNPLTAKLFNRNFHPPEIVFR